MGVIHRAYDRLAAREVAYKRLIVPAEGDRPRFTALFQREYDTLARLNHPHIVAAYDFGFDERGPYYAMELLPGEDLAKLAPVSWRECCRLLRDIASALALIHARRLIHRDISPNNVRISKSGLAKLLDFGALTPFGLPNEVIGTAPFMAPECLNAEPLDQRSDLYSLGALAYWTLTRRLAIRASSLEELPRLWGLPIAPPSTYESSIPAELDDLVLSLLKVDKNARPRSAADAIERLTAIAELDPEQHEQGVALSYLEHTPLSGRAAVAGAMCSALDEVSAGRGAVFVIDGAPGMGRSALLEHLGIEAQLRGAAVLRAAGRVHTGPLGLITHLARTGPATYLSATQPVGGPLTKHSLGVEAAERGPRTPIESAERHAAHTSALRDALLATAARGPVVVLVDDADFADEQSLAVLAAMSETIGHTSILLVLTRLSGPPTSNSLRALTAHAHASSLAPLSREEVSELARNVFGDVPNVQRVAGWLFDEGGGAPASCIELARALLAQRSVRYARGTFILPGALTPGHAREAVRGSVLSAVEGLSFDALMVARVLALCDSALRRRQLERATGRSASEVFAGLGQLLERKLLLESGGQYAIANQALRAVIAKGVAGEQAHLLNLALASMVEVELEPTLLDRYASGHYFIRAGGEHALRGATVIAEAARVRNYDVSLSALSVPYLEAALAVFRERHTPDHELLNLLVPLTISGFYGDLAVQRRHLEATMRALYAVTGLALATRLGRVLGPRLALIVGILCMSMWRLLRPFKMHSRTITENIEAVINVACTASASAGSITQQDEAEHAARYLEPFARTSTGSAMHVARQYCLAVAEACAGAFRSSAARFTQVLLTLETPVRGMDDRVRRQLRGGCYNGLAQVTIELDPRSALDAAAKLAHTGAFFAPHVELTLAMYHGFRGELTAHERHRTQVEVLALPGDLSWSALTLLTLRDHQCAALTGDTNSLVRVTAELERFAWFGPALKIQSELASADLLVLRGRCREAVERYTKILAQNGSMSPFQLMSLSLYARALRESGHVERARSLCEAELASLAADGDISRTHPYRQLIQQLALAEAELGSTESARARLDEQVAIATRAEPNPLTLGALEGDRARVAIVARDQQAFERSYAAMTEWFGATQNPWLLQQCDALLATAVRAGLCGDASGPGTVGDDDDELDGSTEVGPEQTQADRHRTARA